MHLWDKEKCHRQTDVYFAINYKGSPDVYGKSTVYSYFIIADIAIALEYSQIDRNSLTEIEYSFRLVCHSITHKSVFSLHKSTNITSGKNTAVCNFLAKIFIFLLNTQVKLLFFEKLLAFALNERGNKQIKIDSVLSLVRKPFLLTI